MLPSVPTPLLGSQRAWDLGASWAGAPILLVNCDRDNSRLFRAVDYQGDEQLDGAPRRPPRSS